MIQGVSGLGNALVGAALIAAGWAIAGTGVLTSGLGWFAVLAGVVNVLLVFWPAALTFFGSIVLTIVFLAWAGYELRKA